MPLLQTITTPYAEAFLQVVEPSGDTDTVIEQVRQVLGLWKQSAELRDAMGSPVLETGAKKAALSSLFGSDLAPAFMNLLRLLADRQRIGILDSVLERILELHRDQNNIALATVTSAAPLNEEQQKRLADQARAVAGTEKVEINLEVDPSLIGGFVLKVGSRVIDTSLSGQVRRLGLALAGAA